MCSQEVYVCVCVTVFVCDVTLCVSVCDVTVSVCLCVM